MPTGEPTALDVGDVAESEVLDELADVQRVGIVSSDELEDLPRLQGRWHAGGLGGDTEPQAGFG